MFDQYLHCQKLTPPISDEVYSLHVRATDKGRFVVMGWYGARNSTLQTRGAFRIFDTRKEAIDDALTFLGKKVRTGYIDCAQSVVWPNGRAGLITQLVPAPDDYVAGLAGVPTIPQPCSACGARYGATQNGMCGPCAINSLAQKRQQPYSPPFGAPLCVACNLRPQTSGLGGLLCSACASHTPPPTSQPPCKVCGSITASVDYNGFCIPCVNFFRAQPAPPPYTQPPMCIWCGKNPIAQGNYRYCMACATRTGARPPQPPPSSNPACTMCGVRGPRNFPVCRMCAGMAPEPQKRPNLPAIPAWISACFAEIPEPLRPKAAQILGTALPEFASAIAQASTAPKQLVRKKAQGKDTYIVEGLRPGSSYHIPGVGMVINGKINVSAANLLRSQGIDVVPFDWDKPRCTCGNRGTRRDRCAFWCDLLKKPHNLEPDVPEPMVATEILAVDWMRALFLKTPLANRKSLYRQFAKIVHVDSSGNMDLYRRWIETYKRYS